MEDIFHTLKPLLNISRVFGLISWTNRGKLKKEEILLCVIHLCLLFSVFILCCLQTIKLFDDPTVDFTVTELCRVIIFLITSVTPFINIIFSIFFHGNVFDILTKLNAIYKQFEILIINYDLRSIKIYCAVLIIYRFFTRCLIFCLSMNNYYIKNLFLTIVYNLIQELTSELADCQMVVFLYVFYGFAKILNEKIEICEGNELHTLININYDLFVMFGSINQIHSSVLWNIFTIFIVSAYISYRLAISIYDDIFSFVNILRYVMLEFCYLTGLVLMLLNCELIQREVR